MKSEDFGLVKDWNPTRGGRPICPLCRDEMTMEIPITGYMQFKGGTQELLYFHPDNSKRVFFTCVCGVSYRQEGKEWVKE